MKREEKGRVVWMSFLGQIFIFHPGVKVYNSFLNWYYLEFLGPIKSKFFLFEKLVSEGVDFKLTLEERVVVGK